MNLSLLRKFLLILLLLSSFDLLAQDAGVGWVLYNAITRPEEDRGSKIRNLCTGKFTNHKENEKIISDLYFSPLPESATVHELDEEQIEHLQVWTKIENGKFCHPETVSDVLVRHPCLEDSYFNAFANAIELKNKIILDLYSPSPKEFHWGDIDPNSIEFELIIKSEDPKLRDINVKGWDFSWLLGYNPFLSKENACPFQYSLRVLTSDSYHRSIILEDFPL